jgi:hypothetical protein
MRTTLDIADDVLLAAKEVARREKTSVGTALSNLARQSLLGRATRFAARGKPHPLEKYGFKPLPKRGGMVTDDLVNRIRDEEGI